MRILALVEGSGSCGLPQLLPVREQITDLLAGANTQLPQDPVHVGAHGALGEPESFCDLVIGQTSGDKERHFLLATAEGDALRFADGGRPRRRSCLFAAQGILDGSFERHRPPLRQRIFPRRLAEPLARGGDAPIVVGAVELLDGGAHRFAQGRACSEQPRRPYAVALHGGGYGQGLHRARDEPLLPEPSERAQPLRK